MTTTERDEATPDWVREPGKEWHHRADSRGDQFAPFARPQVRCYATLSGDECETRADRGATDDIPAPVCLPCHHLRNTVLRNAREAAARTDSPQWNWASPACQPKPLHEVAIDALDALLRDELGKEPPRYATVAEIAICAGRIHRLYAAGAPAVAVPMVDDKTRKIGADQLAQMLRDDYNDGTVEDTGIVRGIACNGCGRMGDSYGWYCTVCNRPSNA